jgi:hypothetical protein
MLSVAPRWPLTVACRLNAGDLGTFRRMRLIARNVENIELYAKDKGRGKKERFIMAATEKC